ncbi:MAG: hypothetical protein ACI9C2_000826, partial [Gammaproteobacteria bacterium]
WVQLSGTPVDLHDPTTPAPSFEVPEGLESSNAVFQITISDGVNQSVDTVSIAFEANNDGPRAIAGADFQVEENEIVTLQGQGFDPEDQDLTFAWTQVSGPAVVLTDPTAANPNFEAPEGLVNTELVFALSVSDGVNISTDSITVSISANNDAPSANAGSDLIVEESSQVQLVGTGFDPEGSGLTYQWVQSAGPSIVIENASSPTASFQTPNLLVNTNAVFELHVSDGESLSVDTVTITVGADNDAPASDAGPDQNAEEGSLVTLLGSGVDPEGQGLTYSWSQLSGPPVLLTEPSAANPIFVAPEGLVNTEIVFALTVSDGLHQSTDTVAIHLECDNDAPSASAGAPIMADEGDLITLNGSATDPEGQELTYGWLQISGPPVELTDADTPNPTFQAPEGYVNSDFTFELIVSDGSSSSSDTVVVTVEADNDAPSVDAGPARFGAPGDTIELNSMGIDPEGSPLSATWVQVGGPSVELDETEGKSLTFTIPEGSDYSILTFQVIVTDGVNQSTDTVTVSVSANQTGNGSSGATKNLEKLTGDNSSEPGYQAIEKRDFIEAEGFKIDQEYHAERASEFTQHTASLESAEDYLSDTRKQGRNFTHESLASPEQLQSIDLEVEASSGRGFTETFKPREANSEGTDPADEGEPSQGYSEATVAQDNGTAQEANNTLQEHGPSGTEVFHDPLGGTTRVRGPATPGSTEVTPRDPRPDEAGGETQTRRSGTEHFPPSNSIAEDASAEEPVLRGQNLGTATGLPASFRKEVNTTSELQVPSDSQLGSQEFAEDQEVSEAHNQDSDETGFMTRLLGMLGLSEFRKKSLKGQSGQDNNN